MALAMVVADTEEVMRMDSGVWMKWGIPSILTLTSTIAANGYKAQTQAGNYNPARPGRTRHRASPSPAHV